jgi:deoxyribodipyrimidine photo-lyase
VAIDLGRPLVVFESLRVDYRWASDRLHRFVIDGMAEHAAQLAGTAASYIPHVERAAGDDRRLLDALSRDAAAVVTDDYPAFFLPAVIARAGARMAVRLEAVDSNGLLPMRSDRAPFATAFSFRAHMQRTLRSVLAEWPQDIPWSALPPASAWVLPGGTPPPTPISDLTSPDRLIGSLPIDHSVEPVPLRGGEIAARRVLDRFVTTRLARYADDHNHPDLDGTSGLSPYLHFGHISPHDVFEAIATTEGWTSRKLGASAGGRREGWWGVSHSAEAFLDQLVTWRELGVQTCAADPGGYDQFQSLPAWARRTLSEHASDPRPVLYTRGQLEAAATHDEVWNAAQRQLVRDGWMHNYLRMLWG